MAMAWHRGLYFAREDFGNNKYLPNYRLKYESATSGKALIVSHIFLAGHWAPRRASCGCDGRLRTEFY
jgi:hypothetical protein